MNGLSVMKETINQSNEQELSTKQDWVKPVLETCNIEQTMATTGSASDGPSTTP